MMSETNLDLRIIGNAFFSVNFISLEDWMGEESVQFAYLPEIEFKEFLELSKTVVLN